MQNARSSPMALKRQLEPELHEPRVVHGGADRTEASASEVRRGQAAGAVRRRKLGVVEEVEEFRAEVQPHILPRQLELLNEREVGVDEVRADDGRAVGVAEFADGWRAETRCVEPLRHRVRTGVGIAAFNRVGAIEVSDVAVQQGGGYETHTGPGWAWYRTRKDCEGVAIDDGDGEARSDVFDDGDLPIAQHIVDGTAPGRAPFFACAEGQIIDHARSEVIIEVDV